MESHPSYPALSSLVSKYPHQSRCLFQTYNDLLLAQRWSDLEILNLPTCARGAFRGKRPGFEINLCVVPIAMDESLSPSWLEAAFSDLSGPLELYLAITTEDSSLVYYKISQGIIKPPL